MNRRSLLAFLGLAPVAIATGAVAATPNSARTVRGLSALDANVGAASTVELSIDTVQIRAIVREEFLSAYRHAYARRLIT